MKALKLVLLLSIFGVLCALSAAQPYGGYSSSSSSGAMYTSSQPSNYDWLGTGYSRYPYYSSYRYTYYPYYYYPYYRYYNYYPYYNYYYPYYYYYSYPWYSYSWRY